MKEKNTLQSGPPTALLLSGWRRPSKDAYVAPKRPVKFFADWPAKADSEEPEKPSK